jgi:hypothetical protein
MSVPGNAAQAGAIGFDLLHRSLPGKKTNVASRCQMAAIISKAIWNHFQVGPYQWQLKHCLWYLDVCSSALSNSRRFQHWLTLRELLYALKKSDAWVKVLQERKNATYLRLTGKAGKLKVGRPPNLP